MRRLTYIFIAFLLSAAALQAQRRGFDPEKIYRPVYGYVMDTLTNQPLAGVMVYGFDSKDDALVGKKALETKRSPLKIKLKGDAVEVKTDVSGRYMLPARSNGVLLFWFKDSGKAVMEEICGRSSVSLGRKEKEWSVDDLDLDKYIIRDRDVRKGRRLVPVGVDLDMDFKCYLPYLGEDASVSRIWVERRVTDMETGEILDCHVPVVSDGRDYHRKAKRLHAKKTICDTLIPYAEKNAFLTEKTSELRVTDPFSTEPWKDKCFRLGYYVIQDKAGEIRHLDTLHMLTNRVSKPLKYIGYEYEPCLLPVPVPEEVQSVRKVKRRIVLNGQYDGKMPEVLQDPAYLLEELHLKAEVTSCGTYQENILRADSIVNMAMTELRRTFAAKMNEGVRVTKTSSSPSQSGDDKVGYRMVFRTDRRFSQGDYLELFSRSEDAHELEKLCLRAMEESYILEGKSWEYAANVLASMRILNGSADTGLLEPFIDTDLEGCDMAGKNRREVVANQVMMLMMSGQDRQAASLAAILPDENASLRVLAACKSGVVPETQDEIEALAVSSPQNMVVADMFTGLLDSRTAEALKVMSEEKAVTWLLRARYLCLMYDNDLAEMRTALVEGTEMTVYDTVMHCLERCFGTDPGFKTIASHDAAIEENALKEVLGVLVL